MDQKIKLSYLAVISIVMVFTFVSFAAMAKNDNAKNDKSSQSEKNKSAKVNLKSFEKPDVSNGETNAQVHKEKSKEVTTALKEAAKEQKEAGKTEVGNQIQQVANEQELSETPTAEAIEEVETRGKVKTFLFGTDYKNLGQLRSSLVHNRNEIRKLTKTLALVLTVEEKAAIEAQLLTLTQERERIKTVITDNETSFSLFGWVSRFLTNYEETPINEEEENDLTEEVEQAIEDTTDENGNPVPTIPAVTTDPTDPAAPTAPVTPIN